ncbi:hypothetical protein M011DRAFT_477050 [Sporormia fimetaria CBS 119925]|uniref:Fermentation associated protein n=1 Tax=Sporormia fimetaria CBS 119925 TaxID=1340428 RepID=A0A6A6VCL2_9PLEO|nr:hypothetical protein M011DRAFT_477050 [Sporormia fimetaria CBS 119925]
MANSIISEPLNPNDGFNWVFLVEMLICGILTVFFLFYFNRLFATLVSYGIRAYTWRKYHAYIDIQSLQISLLGGRLFFKDIRYHGHNETILLHGGHITWQYWLRRVRKADLYSADGTSTGPHTPKTRASRTGRSDSREKSEDSAERGGEKSQKKLPCRISIKLSGLEAFMYNRSPAYDAIVAALQNRTSGPSAPGGLPVPHESSDSSKGIHQTVSSDIETEKPNSNSSSGLDDANARSTPQVPTGLFSAPTKKPDLPAFLQLLPVSVDCNKGAIVIGNEHTESVITARFERATGEFDAGKSGPLDLYQQLFNFSVMHPVVHMRPNPDFNMTQLKFAAQVKGDGEGTASEPVTKEHGRGQDKSWKRWKMWHSLSALFSSSADSICTDTHSSPTNRRQRLQNPQIGLSATGEWKGLARYKDEDQDNGHGEWGSVEYALMPLILDSPRIDVSFYWDVTGPVPQELENSLYVDPAHAEDINGSVPPQYGVDIQVFGGTINYGPWADRRRAMLQSMFFPSSHVDATPASRLASGDSRVLTVFKVFVSMEEDTTLRIPIREPSKDVKWKGKTQGVLARENQANSRSKSGSKKRPKRKDATTPSVTGRPFGWIDVMVAKNTSLSYVMDMVASQAGYHSTLGMDIVSSEISTSVNHGLLWRSGRIGVECDLSTPLGWNQLRTWAFQISCQDLELFLLRDHLFLLTDLVTDWGSGPGSDYFNFVPFQYLLNLDFGDFKMYLNTNDGNIVNNPADLDDNNFLVLHGARLHGTAKIPLDQYKPKQNSIYFDVQANSLGLDVCMPARSTLKAFIKDKTVARVGELSLKGSHTYIADTAPSNTDRLFLDLNGSTLSIALYGWLIHHFMKLKDNYFGDDLHFKTLEEFQGLTVPTNAADAAPSNGEVNKLSNDLDVILCISVEEGAVLLPSHLYSADSSVRADISYASADLRFTNYYMDLMVNFSPINLSRGLPVGDLEQSKMISGQTEVFIQTVTIYGHRLFGLPPVEPTYVCNWDFDVGELTGDCTPEFIECAVGAARSFAFTFDDPENALALTDPVVIFDSTFLRLQTQDIRLWLQVDEEALLFSTGPVRLDFNDLADLRFSERLNVYIPDLTLGVTDSQSALRHQRRDCDRDTVNTHAFFQTTVSLAMLGRKLNFREQRSNQQNHMQEQDQRTHRTPFMLTDQIPSNLRRDAGAIRPPAMQFPDVPQPISLIRPPHRVSQHSDSISQGLSDRKQRSFSGLVRSPSVASFSASVRSALEHHKHHGSVHPGSEPTQAEPFGNKLSTSAIGSRGGARTSGFERPSFIFSSPLVPPNFHLDGTKFDLSEVPPLPDTHFDLGTSKQDSSGGSVYVNDVPADHLDEAISHVSFIVALETGLRCYFTPKSVRCVSNLLGYVLSERPDDVLDDFQVGVLTKILDLEKRLEGKGKSTEVSVIVPFAHIRFQNAFQSCVGAGYCTDQYDVILNRFNVSARTKKLSADQAMGNSFALHSTLGSLGLSATEKGSQGMSDVVAIQAELRELLAWTLADKETSVKITFKAFEAATASRKIDYLASLIHRTTLLSDELVMRFQRLVETRKMRLRYLVWFLTNAQHGFPDPPFLNKASYALRADREHLRNHDSWKIVSHLRYVWQRLPSTERTKILSDCSQGAASCPEGAGEKIITLWKQWRTWDLAHAEKSLAMGTLFGKTDIPGSVRSSSALQLDVRSQSIRLVVDPGPNQSEVFLGVIALKVTATPPSEPAGLMLLPEDTTKKTTVIQLSTVETSIHLRWEICELVEILTKKFQNIKPAHHELGKSGLNLSDSSESHDLQVVYISERLEIALDTINLLGTSTGQRLRFSIALSLSARNESRIATALLHLDRAIMQLRFRTRPLLEMQYDHPSLYLAYHTIGVEDTTPQKIQVAGASRMIKLTVQEDILGFIEAFDHVLRDEVAYLHRHATGLQKTASKADQEPNPGSPSQLPNITLALFVDTYLIELPLLQSLTWKIAGSFGRLSVVPSLGKHVTLKLDYDLAAHEHTMVTQSQIATDIISALEFPPLNGRLIVKNTDNKIRLSASGIIETIQIQASEIQAILTMLNKPEFANLLHAVNEDLDVLKAHWRETFPDTTPRPMPTKIEPSRDVMFDVGMTFSGLSIVANAPGTSSQSPTANIAASVTTIQLKATNIDSNMRRLSLPDVVVQLGQMNLEAKLLDAEQVRRCGNVTLGAAFRATTQEDSEGSRRTYSLRSSAIDVNLFADTASAVVDVLNHMQDRIKDLDLSKEKKYLRRLRHTGSRATHRQQTSAGTAGIENQSTSELFTSTYALDLQRIQVSWIVGTSIPAYVQSESEDLVLSFSRINFHTRKGESAKLMVENTQLQMVPVSAPKHIRSGNSALLPEVVFYVSYASGQDARKVAFKAAGKSLDVRLDSRFILPANVIERSIGLAGKKFRAASASWSKTPNPSGGQRANIFGNKRLASLLVDASFAGAVVHINGSKMLQSQEKSSSRAQQKGRYSQFVGDETKSNMVLKAPGIALKVEHKDDGQDPSLNAEFKIDASSNTLYPTVVPIMIDISESIKLVVRDDEESPSTDTKPDPPAKPVARLLDDENLLTADPSTFLGKSRLNIGLRICKQEFSLSCQPIARVAAIAKLDDIYVTVSSVKSQEHGHFFAVSAAFQKFQAKVQHVYSRESTFGFEVESILLSLMNSKHLGGASGISAILKIDPMGLQINARQLQDFLLFREIWLPPEIRERSKPPGATATQDSQEYLMQRYEQVTAATAFPWNASVALTQVSVDLDLGQAIGKTSLQLRNLWASSKKSSDWEQNMCIGAEVIGIESTGRTSGFVELQGVKVRTSISWPSQAVGIRQTPLVQASVGFDQLRVKSGFDYQAFVIADTANFNFLMYNVRQQLQGAPDRLVAVLDGERAQIFCTATTAAQGLALFQAIERLVQDNKQAYAQSLREIERFLRRKSSTAYGRSPSQSTVIPKPPDSGLKMPISLSTDVVVTLHHFNIGIFPSTFVDTQVFTIEAEDIHARFAAALDQGKIHSGLGMTLGKLSVALATIPSQKHTTPLADITVNDVVESARSARGGIILRVPKVIADMHTWQAPNSDTIDYIFSSNLEGKVDVGWNYSRISYIRTMWSNHSRSLASRLGKPLPESNIKITSSQHASSSSSSATSSTSKLKDLADTAAAKQKDVDPGQEKITAEIRVPQSKYTYHALEPPIIETPQLRDMGEATPPLEWIGLHRDRLPNVTHQIVIVTLLEVAREVEEAYTRILGGS